MKESLLERSHRNVPRGVSTVHPLAVSRGRGARLWDSEGREFIDFVGGIGVMNVGHNHPKVVAAVRDQLDALTHTCFQVAHYAGYVELAERLNGLVGGGRPCKTLLLSTGAEAVENAVKIARAHTNRPAVVAFSGAFHGRTLLGMSLTANGTRQRQNFGPFAPEIYHSPYPYPLRGWTEEAALGALLQLFETRLPPDRVAAVIIEPQLGEGGFVPAPPRFMSALRRLTEEHGIVLVLDEIQTGFGRTGKMFGFEHHGIEPDLVTLAKSLGGGLPLSAVVGRAEIMDAPLPGGLGGTYAGNPLACAAALAVLDVMVEEQLLERAQKLGERLRAALSALAARFPCVGEVRGLGPMLALELVRDRQTGEPATELTRQVIEKARDEGLLLLPAGVHRNVIRILVPLVATPEEIDLGLERLERAFTATA